MGRHGLPPTRLLGGGWRETTQYRALELLFDIAAERSEWCTYALSLSILEVYNEAVRDLLCDDPNAVGPAGLTVQAGVVKDLTWLSVGALGEVTSAISRASQNRAVGSHNMNQHSSRSHLIVSIAVWAVGSLKDP